VSEYPSPQKYTLDLDLAFAFSVFTAIAEWGRGTRSSIAVENRLTLEPFHP
jgi:hypothetical protein